NLTRNRSRAATENHGSSTVTTFSSVYASAPASPPSHTSPLPFTPPHGKCASSGLQQFTPVAPTFNIERDHRPDRPEDLLAQNPHSIVCVPKNGRAHEPAALGVRRTSSQELGAFFDSELNITIHPLVLRLFGERTHLHARLVRIADFDCIGSR